MITFCVLLAILGLIIYAISAAHKRRHEALMLKYDGDKALVDRLMAGEYWQGQPSRQLFDALGAPSDVDTKVMKSKIKEIWKYNKTGKNRYGLRITVDNDIVVGWDKKD